MSEGAREAVVGHGVRGLEELKAETQRRADHNLPPLTGIDPDDARVCVRRTDHGREDLLRKVDVVAETAFPRDETQVLPARDRLAYTGVSRSRHCFGLSVVQHRLSCLMIGSNCLDP